MSLFLMKIEDWTFLTGHDCKKLLGFDFHHFFDHQYQNKLNPNQHRVHQMTLGFGQTNSMDHNYEFELPLSSNSFLIQFQKMLIS